MFNMQKPQYRKNSSHLVISHEKYSEDRFHEWEHFTYPKFANITECIHFTITPCTNVFTQLLMSFCSAFKFSFGVDWRNSGSKRSLSGEISEQLSFCSIKKPLNEVHICLLLMLFLPIIWPTIGVLTANLQGCHLSSHPTLLWWGRKRWCYKMLS